MATTGTVIAVIGQAFVVHENGVRKPIIVGDLIVAGDTIITDKGVMVELQLDNNKIIEISSEQTVKLTVDVLDTGLLHATDNSIDASTIQTIIKAIQSGGDITDAIKETASGLDADVARNKSGGFTFTDLLRLDEVLNQFNFEFDRAGLCENC